MSEFTIATADRTIINYSKRTPAQTLRVAQAYAWRNIKGSAQYLSVRDLEALTADQAAPLKRNRINVLIKAVHAAPADVDPETFVTVYVKAESDKSRGSQPTEVTVPQGDTDTEALTEAAKNAGVTAPVHTLDTLTDRLADLFADARAHLSEADFSRFLFSVAAEYDEGATVTVAA